MGPGRRDGRRRRAARRPVRHRGLPNARSRDRRRRTAAHGDRLTRQTGGMDVTRLDVGGATLLRVPYAEIMVAPEVVSMTSDEVAAIEWAAPHWAEGSQVRVA